MRLDSERQRELLINCIMATELSGTVKELTPVISDIGNLLDAVEKAELENTVPLGDLKLTKEEE